MDAGRVDGARGAKHETVVKCQWRLINSIVLENYRMNRDPLLKAGALLLVLATLGLSSVAQQPAKEPKDRECTISAYNGKLDQKPKILAKPEPKFNLEERRRYDGQVITLRALLCGSGKVTGIEVKEGVGDGANEKAIEAARKIKFTPGVKDGNNVSRFVVLKYFVQSY